MPDNPNYEERDGGNWRKENAPDAKHKSRINWARVESVENARQGVSELRRIQNQRNEEHRKRHGDE